MRIRSRKPAMLAMLCVAAITLPGCYSRTIESDGLGTHWEQRDIYKPNVEKKKPKESGSQSSRKGGLFNNIGDFFFGSDDG